MNFVFASQNPDKIAEVRAKLPAYTIKGLDPTVFTEELLETGNTLEANALQKVRQVYKETGGNCFADDTGLEVESLNGTPGVYSARYAGEQKNSEDNMALLLQKLEGKDNRRARFRTVIALIWEGKEYIFEGVCEGAIVTVRSGAKGFGYDPIFMPDGEERTFADMSVAAKATMSHRGRALEKLITFIKSKND